jgi:hypothetical protein
MLYFLKGNYNLYWYLTIIYWIWFWNINDINRIIYGHLNYEESINISVMNLDFYHKNHERINEKV